MTSLREKITSLSKGERLGATNGICAMRAKTCPRCKGSGYNVEKRGPFVEGRICDCIEKCMVCEGNAMIRVDNSMRACSDRHPGRISHLINDAEIPARYVDARLSRFANLSGNAPKLVRQVHTWLRGFDPDKGPGLVLSGNVGVGKTYLLAALAMEFCDRGISSKLVDFHRLLALIREAYTERKSDESIIHPLASVDVLMIDEFGKGRNSDWELEKLDQIVMARYNQAKPMVIATNYHLRGKSAEEKFYNFEDNPNQFNPDQFGSLESRVGQRIYSRLKETCLFMELSAEDYRPTLAPAQKQKVQAESQGSETRPGPYIPRN